MVDDEYGSHGGVEQAGDAVERLQAGQGSTSRGFMSDEGWLSVVADDNWLTDYEGRGLASLKHGTGDGARTGA